VKGYKRAINALMQEVSVLSCEATKIALLSTRMLANTETIVTEGICCSTSSKLVWENMKVRKLDS
tara:strand:- start:123 stop:317 length:195 start_codon:yes stop_codon:yes gene_type:complete